MEDTIAAVATAPGRGGIAVIRISGPKARSVGARAFHPARWESHRMIYGHVMREGEPLDEALAVYFEAGRSYTGEDTVEIQCHGGSRIASLVLECVLCAGARPAQPGEFTKRAFLNGRIDLSQAEAVMDLINADTELAARAAYRQAEGRLAKRVREWQAQLTDMRAELEVTLDYPEEDLEEATAAKLARAMQALREGLRQALGEGRGALLREGFRVAIAGRPNAGKSSLLNALLGEERAIVTDVPGTTRDALRERMNLRGIPVELTDTAGIRDAVDPVERVGVKRARAAMAEADAVILVWDRSEPLTEEDWALAAELGSRGIRVASKADLEPAWDLEPGMIPLSARTGEGVAALLDTLYEAATAGEGLSPDELTNQRHIEAVRRSLAALDRALAGLAARITLDCVAVDLAECWLCLGEITGERIEERVIDRIFERFCVGK